MPNNTISEVVKNGLCTGCGTCVALCSEKAVEMILDRTKGIYLPQINKEKCSNCGMCYKVCPGHEVDFNQLNLEIFRKKPRNIFVGNYINCYSGHSTNYKIRYNSSSGGLISQLLIFALKKKLIDGVLVTRIKKDNPLQPEPFIARTAKGVLEASKSKYCPVPANISLTEIIESDVDEKFAVVGLPCHIHGVRKAEMIDKKLKEKIVLHLGIFCNHTPNFWGIKLLLEKLNIKEDDIIRLEYRGEGWPGYMKISLHNGKILIPLSDYWRFIGSYFFYPPRCLMCSDGICELADISFGDAWISELSDDKIGSSILISKSEIGEKILEEMESIDQIKLTKIGINKLIQSQAGMLYSRKKNPNISKMLYKKSPKFNMQSDLLKMDTGDYLLALFPYLNSYVSRNQFLRNVLCHIPLKIIRLYDAPYNTIRTIKVKKTLRIRH